MLRNRPVLNKDVIEIHKNKVANKGLKNLIDEVHKCTWSIIKAE